MGRTVAATTARTAVCRAVGIALAGAALLLAGCPTSSLLNEVKHRTEGSYSQLASLSLPNVTLSPSFSPTVTSYIASVGYTVASITIVPMSYKSDATITVNGTAVVSGATSAAVPLNVGENTITVVVSYTNSAATTYTLTITRLSQMDLAAIAVTGASTNPLLSPPFRPLITSYTLTAANTETSVTITPTAADPLATVVVNPSGPINISSLAVGATLPVTIMVTPAGGGSSRVYTITVSRQPLGFVLDTAWGSNGRVGPDLTGDSRLYCPTAIAASSSQVYIHDSRNFRVQVFDTSGNPVRRWGSYGGGYGQFNDTRGGGIAYYGSYVYDQNGGRIQKFQISDGSFVAQFGSGLSSESRIACDPSGNIYVADRYNSRVLKFDSNGNQVGSAWSTAAQPTCITADSSYVYVGEYSQIQKFSVGGTLQDTWSNSLYDMFGLALVGGTLYAATWSVISSVSTSNGATATVASGLPNISDLATDGTYLYTVSGADYRCYKYNTSGVLQGSWGSDLTTAPGMRSPQRAVVDSLGNLYVADTGNTRVLKFGPTGTYLSTLTPSASSSLYGMAVDSTYLYVADSSSGGGHNRIARFLLSSGAAQTDLVGSLNSPMGVAVDGNGRIYVANTNAGTVLMYNSSGVQQGSAATGFSGPRAIAADGANNLYVADSNNCCIKKYSVNMASLLLQWGSNGYNNGQFYSISDVCAGAAGVLVPQGDYQMQQFDTSGTYVSRVPAGQWGATSPQSIVGSTFDSSGNLYIVDSTNCSVRRYKPQ